MWKQVRAFSVITNLRMELFEALVQTWVELWDLVEETHPVPVHVPRHPVHEQRALVPGPGQLHNNKFLEIFSHFLEIFFRRTRIRSKYFSHDGKYYNSYKNIYECIRKIFSGNGQKIYGIKMIKTKVTLYTERWVSSSLSSSSAEAAAATLPSGEEEEVALLHTPRTSSSCIAHCFSFLFKWVSVKITIILTSNERPQKEWCW